MDGVMTVRELQEELGNFPPEATVMVAVVKYPEEFKLRFKDGKYSWTDSTDVECHPLEHGEITQQDGLVILAVELTDYDRLRHFAGG